MTEAVIVLPIFGLVLVGLPLVGEAYGAGQQMLLEARRCAWAYALSGCTETAAGCESSARDPANDDVARGDLPPDQAAALAREDIVAQTRATTGSSGSDVFDEVPVLGSALAAIFGATGYARMSRDLPPRGGRSREVSSDFAIACNERPREVIELAKDVFCARAPLDLCGGSR